MKFIVPSRGDSPRSHLPIAIIIDKSESTKDIRDLLNKCIVNAVNEQPLNALSPIYVIELGNVTELTLAPEKALFAISLLKALAFRVAVDTAIAARKWQSDQIERWNLTGEQDISL